jgi:CshA-type fibril repeat protein
LPEDDVSLVSPNTVVKGNVLKNDTNVDGNVLHVISAKVDLNGDGLLDNLPIGTPTAVKDAAGNPIGTLLLNGNGSYSFTPAKDYSGDIPTVSYTVSDGHGHTPEATLSLVMSNASPIAINDVIDVIEDTPVSGNLLGNDTDPDGNVLIITKAVVEGQSAPLVLGVPTAVKDSAGNPVGTLTINSNGSYSFVPEHDYFGPVPKVTYTVSDGNGGPATAQLILGTVQSIIDPLPDQIIAEIDNPIVIHILSNDPNIDPSTVQFVGTTKPGEPLVVPGEGTWTFDPATHDATFTPESGFHGGPSPVEYTVTDENGRVSSPVTVKVDIKPVTTSDKSINVNPGKPFVVDILANDKVVDPKTVQLVGTKNPGEPLVVPGEGTWTIDPNTGALSFTPLPSFSGAPKPVQYTVKSISGLVSDPTQVEVLVKPLVTPDQAITLPNRPVTLDILANDKAVDPKTVQLVGTKNPGEPLVVPGEGTWSVDPTTGALTFTPLPSFSGAPKPVQYTVKSTSGLVSDPTQVEVLVKPLVTPDQVTSLPDRPVTVDVLANDKAVDPKTVQIVGTPKPGAPLVVPGEGIWKVETGKLTFTPLPTFHGTPTPIHYTVKSIDGVVSEPTLVTINLVPDEIGSLIMLSNPQAPSVPNRYVPTPYERTPVTPLWEHDWFKPVDLSIVDYGEGCDLFMTGELKNQVVHEREPYHFSIPEGTFRHTKPNEQLEYTATHPDGSPLPDWLKFDKKTLTFSGVPPKGALSEEVMVTVRDRCGDEVHATFHVKVNRDHHTINRDNHKGKMGLSKQLHAAGKMGKLQHGRELLKSLRTELDNQNTTILAANAKK